MKLTNLLFASCIIFMTSCQGSKVAKTIVGDDNQTFTLEWSDEFDYNGLPDASKWDYEEGFVRNQEAQYFTKARIENAEVRDGALYITAIKEQYKGAEYTSASVITKGIKEFTYGRIEISAQVPNGLGVWPALWTLGVNIEQVGWPLCGEIDMLEFVGHDPEHVHFNIHSQKYNHTNKTNIGYIHNVESPWDGFHQYAVEWYPDHINWFYDGVKIFTAAKQEGDGVEGWPFEDAAQYLIMNLAIGGTWGAEKGIDDSAFPQALVIDYARIYKLDK